MPTQTKMQHAGAEVGQLRACINNLIGVVALPAIWKGAAPSEIGRTLLDTLLRILHLDFVYLRVKDPAGESPFEAVRTARSPAAGVQLEEIRQLFKGWSEDRPQITPQLMQKHFGDGEFSILQFPLGLGGDVGILVAGSQRADFPLQTERLLLSVAANQATIGLQEAWLLSEQKRVADELDRRVAQQTDELAAANKELLNRERRIRRLVDSNIIGIVIWDLDGRLIDANDAFLRMVRYEREDLQAGLRWFDMTPPEWQEAHARYEAEELKATGMMQAREKEYFRKDGSRVPVLIGAACFEDQPTQGVAYILDLTEQKRAEEALRRSQADLAEAQTLSHTGSWRWNVASGKVVWSPEYFAILGFNPEKDHPSYQLYLDRIHPEDRPTIREARRAAAEGKKDFEAEYRLLLPGGLIKHVHSIGHCSVYQTGDVEYIGAVMDITERKRAEEERERLRQAQRVVVETANDAVVSADESGTIQFANPATMRVFGYDPKELIGKPLTVLMPESMKGLHENGFRRYLATGQRHLNWQGTELTGLRENGQEFPVEVAFGELAINGHRVFTGFIRDISERKRAEEERERLRQTQAELARVNRMSTMGELTASLAHEIKQPITSAVTNAQTCLRFLRRAQPDVSDAEAAASRLVQDITRASEIISRIGSLFQKGVLQRELVDINELAREMIALLRSEAATNSISIHSDLASGLPQIMADRVQLQQVLMNLMLNGIEAMKGMGGSGKLTITSSQTEDHQLLVSVADTGVGIRPEQALQ
ncbi:MAG TPA: PAS domain S-box protein, partial [Terriglobia bacterium]|nr:PAS domain S-box protein [Terriglobia bacterium]